MDMLMSDVGQFGLSVLMAVYAKDDANHLDRALASVIDLQTRPADEVVIVEDGPLSGPLDQALDIWEVRAPGLIRRIKLEVNRGLSVALNEGLKACCYDLVARMDADDVSEPSRFQRQTEFLEENRHVDVLGTWAVEVDQDGNKGAIRKKPIGHDQIFRRIWTNPIIHPSVIFRREFVLRVGGYDPHLRRSEDYDLWFRVAAANGRFENIPEPLLLYRFDERSHSKQPLRFALERSLVGYKGACRLRLPMWSRAGCFFPVFRALFPNRLQHQLYAISRRFLERF